MSQHTLPISNGQLFLQPLDPYPYNVKEKLTKDSIKKRTKNIYSRISFGKDFYGFSKNDPQIKSSKWKTYLYLRKCVVDYKDGKVNELKNVLKFLKDPDNKTWFKSRLRDKSSKNQDEEWGSGYHEWLKCSLIVDVIKRSAGMEDKVEADVEFWDDSNTIQIDWLYLQAVVRSPTKYVLFKNKQKTVEYGHCGAIKNNLKGRGFCVEGSEKFHENLKEAFEVSCSISAYLKRIKKIFKNSLVSGKSYVYPSLISRYVVSGALTSNAQQINNFCQTKLKNEGYDKFKERINELINIANDEDFEDSFEEDEFEPEHKFTIIHCSNGLSFEVID